jgi:4-amino-4-deoxy-L-arabinose transferase-like glycosyltransferase
MYTPAAMLLRARPAVAERAGEYRQRWRLRAGSDVQMLVGLMLVATVLRFATITGQSYWLDESQAVHELRLPFGAMLHAWSTTEWNPPLYLLIAWPWAKLLGTGELALRALSALLGVAVVPLLYLSGRELVSRRAGLMAAGLTAVNPFMIWYSQEAREYMLLVALCSASLWCFARAWRAPTGRALLWWAVVSALALLTQYFAGFLVAAEGLLLVYRARNRASVAALASMAVVLAPFVPHVIPHVRRPTGFIVQVALSVRLQQLPVSFGLFPVYQGSGTHYGLIAAAGIAAMLIPLLLVGLPDAELRGAGVAALLAAAVIGIPLVLALAGHDNFIARGLMPAWPPLAVVIGAACAAPRARVFGTAFALLLGALFVYGYVRVNSDAQFQKPDVRAVASQLGRSSRPRAIVAYGDQFTTGPLSVYMPDVAWAGPGEKAPPPAPVAVGELDIVGSAGDTLSGARHGFRLLSARTVAGYQVDRLLAPAGFRATPAAIYDRATALLGPAPPLTGAPPVIFQGRSA